MEQPRRGAFHVKLVNLRTMGAHGGAFADTPKALQGESC